MNVKSVVLNGEKRNEYLINQSINVYSSKQPKLIFQQMKAFAVATLVHSYNKIDYITSPSSQE